MISPFLKKLLNNPRILITILIFCITPQCAHKRRYNFSDKQNKRLIKKLSLPYTRNLTVERNKKLNINSLYWEKSEDSNNDNKAKKKTNSTVEFLGYNVYALSSWSIIPKKSINKKPIKKTFFTHSTNKSFFYVVKTVFKNKNQVILGPVSNICKAH